MRLKTRLWPIELRIWKGLEGKYVVRFFAPEWAPEMGKRFNIDH